VKDVVLHDFFADEDRVLEVVAVPRHEGHEHVTAERQLAVLRAGTVGDDLAFADMVALVTRIFWLCRSPRSSA